MATMFDKIKKQNGERFAKAIRNYNNGIFDVPDLDKIVRYAGRDAEPIMNYLVSLMDIKIEEHAVHQDPIHLLKMAGYDAFVADTLEKQNSIMEYYAPGEELCTFRDPERYKKYYIIHAVKKNVGDIKRKDFKNPKREDEYGTSVISIQILKSGGFISIKNRYNHTVQNPDNTLNSNPDNIIHGLADALKHKFDVDFSSQKVTVPDGYILLNGQIIKYNFEYGNTYVGENFYIRNGDSNVTTIDTNSQIKMDYFMLDLKNKKLLNPMNVNDAFFEIFNKQLQASKKICVKKDSEKQHCIYLDGACCVKIKDGKITSVSLPGVTEIRNKFLIFNDALVQISLPDVTKIGDNFLLHNKKLSEISVPKVEIIGNAFLWNNDSLSRISLPAIKKIGFNFMFKNQILTEISLPNVTEIGYSFLQENISMSQISLPNVEKIGSDFLSRNSELTEISLPNAVAVGYRFLYSNKKLSNVSLPNAVYIGIHFLSNNTVLSQISLPNVTEIGMHFLFNNKKLSEISLPKIEKIESGFLGLTDEQIVDVIKNKAYKRLALTEGFKTSTKKMYQEMQIKYKNLTNKKEERC